MLPIDRFYYTLPSHFSNVQAVRIFFIGSLQKKIRRLSPFATINHTLIDRSGQSFRYIKSAN